MSGIEMSKIVLDEKFTMVADSQNWILKYENQHQVDTPEGGKKTVTTNDEWYFPTIQGCLRKYMQQSPKTSMSVDELMDKLDAIEIRISKLAYELR